MKFQLTVVVLTKNEADNIQRCLKSVDWSDNIILIDNSADDTVKIAQRVLPKGKLQVFGSREEANFAKLRNFAFVHAKNNWVMFLDADEEMTSELAQEIRQAIVNSPVNGYYIKRRDYFLGRWLEYGETGNIKMIKLGRKDSGRWRRSVHEVWEIKGKLGELENPLLHYPHPTVVEFCSRINRWTTMDTQEFFTHGEKSSFWHIIAYPLAKFGINYFVKKGFLDGIPGLIMAILMSFHSFLTRAKLFMQIKT